MKLTLVEKMIVVVVVMIITVIVYGWFVPIQDGPTFIRIQVPPGFLATGFQKSNYVVGTYRGAPAVYDVMRDEVRVVQPSTTGTLVLEDTKGGV
jgi:hypothetical protein